LGAVFVTVEDGDVAARVAVLLVKAEEIGVEEKLRCEGIRVQPEEERILELRRAVLAPIVIFAGWRWEEGKDNTPYSNSNLDAERSRVMCKWGRGTRH
jgi:hypothetical protein